MTSAMLMLSDGSTPTTRVAEACGSASITSVVWPFRESAEASMVVTVVLPTPPFWFASAITNLSSLRKLLGTPAFFLARKNVHRIRGLQTSFRGYAEAPSACRIAFLQE